MSELVLNKGMSLSKENNQEKLLKARKVLSIFGTLIDVTTIVYILSIVWSMQPGWAYVTGFRRTFIDTFSTYFPFNDVHMTWALLVIFPIIITINAIIFKTRPDIFKSKFSFWFDTAWRIFMIAFCIGWLVIVAMGVVGEVLHFFNFIPYEWIPFLNHIF